MEGQSEDQSECRLEDLEVDAQLEDRLECPLDGQSEGRLKDLPV